MGDKTKGLWAALVQFVKFGLVGVSNTAISYGIEMLCYYLLFAQLAWPESSKILVTSVLAFAASVTNSYYWNSRCVFKTEGRRTAAQRLAAYLKTAASYGATGLVLAPALKVYLSGLGVPYWVASLGALIVTIPLNFLLNRFWAFKKR